MNHPATVFSNSNYSFWPIDEPAPALIEASPSVSTSPSSESPAHTLKKPSPPTVSSKPRISPVSFKPQKVMYPMKESQHDSEINRSAIAGNADNARPHLLPLDMVQKIISLAENKSPNFAAGLRNSSLRAFLDGHSRKSTGPRAGEKRKSDRADEEAVGADSVGSEESAEILVESHGKPKPRALRPSVQNSNEKKKNNFQIYMVEWLKNNMTNPYPCDEMQNNLARFLLFQARCITVKKSDAKVLEGNNPCGYRRNMISIATEKISNWLVNVRSRKWRPSIEQAFDAKRPAALLLEDSIRIYEGRALRRIKGWDGEALFESDPIYSMSLSMWKKERGHPVKVMEVKAVKRAGNDGKKKMGAIPADLMPKKERRYPAKVTEVKATKRTASYGKKKTGAESDGLNTFVPLPALAMSPLCDQVDELMVSTDMIVTEFAAV